MNQLTVETEPSEIWAKISAGQRCQIIDVREPGEYQSVHIAGSKLLPLSSFKDPMKDPLKDLRGVIDTDVPVYFVCQSGNRARQAANKLSELGIKDTHIIKGGIGAWLQSGYPVERGEGGAWSLERQVRITSGLLILLGIALAYTVSATWICLSAFIALGMIVSAVSNTCGMGLLLSKMPWNQSCVQLPK